MKLPTTWPKIVERGHSVAKIYRTPSNGYDQFTVVYYLADNRVRRTFSEFPLAVTEAEIIATKLSEGELSVLQLKGDDRAAYLRAVQLIRSTSVPLEMAALQFAEAHGILKGAPLAEAARFYAKHHPANAPKKQLAEVIDELLSAKEGDGLSEVYLKDLRGRLRRFEKALRGWIAEVTVPAIERFLRDLKGADRDGRATGPLSPSSRNNYRRAIGTLFYFAESRGYVLKGIVDIESVSEP